MDYSSETLKGHKSFSQNQSPSLNALAVTMCLLGAIFYCYEYYLRVAPSVMSAELKQTFNLSEAAFGHLAACYYYAYTPMQVPVGMMMDRFGPRRILSIACLLCALGTYFFAGTSWIFVAQMGRFLVGFGSAFAYVGVLKLSSVWLPEKYFALMAGLCTALGMVGATTGAVTMSALVDNIGWQNTLYYAAGVGLCLTLILWLVLRDHNPLNAPTQPETPRPSQCAGLKEMLLNKEIWISGIIGCLTFLPIAGFAEVWAVSFLKVVGLSKSEAALGASMVFVGFAIGGPMWGLLSDKWKSRRRPLIIGSFVSAFLMAWVVFKPTAHVYGMYALLLLSAFFASAQILVFAVSHDCSRSEASATAAALTNMIVMIGGALVPPTIGYFLDSHLQLESSLPINSLTDYAKALAVLPIALGISGVLSVILKESYPGSKKAARIG